MAKKDLLLSLGVQDLEKALAEIAQFNNAAKAQARDLKTQAKSTAKVQRTESDKTRKTTVKNNGLIRESFDSLKASALAFVGIAGAKQVFEFAKGGAQVLELEESFKKAGGTAQQLQDILDGLSGTVSDKVALKMANTAQTLGIPLERVDEMARIAGAAASKLGEDVDFMFESIVRGTARGSVPILDNLGILIKSEEAYNKYAASLGKVAAQLSDTEKKQAFLNAVIEAGADIVDTAPVDSYAKSMARAETAVENLKDTVAKKLAPVIAGAVKDLAALFGSGSLSDTTGTRSEVARERIQRLTDVLATQFGTQGAIRPTSELESLGFGGTYLVTRRAVEKELELAKSFIKIEDARRKAASDRLEARKKEKEETKKFNEELDEENEEILFQLEQEKALAELRKRRAQEAQAYSDRRFAISQKDAERQARLTLSGADLELELLDLKHRNELRAAKRAGEDVAILQRLQAKQRSDLLAKQGKAELDARSALVDKRLAKAEESARLELETIQRVLIEQAGTLDEFTTARLRKRRDTLSTRLGEDPNKAFADEKAARFNAGKTAGAEEGLLAFIGEEDEERIRGIEAAIAEGIITPLQAATEAAEDFARSFGNAAAAAIFESKSLKEAANTALRTIAQRSAAEALFQVGKGLAALAVGNVPSATLHFQSAATFGGISAVASAGAALTGGVRGPNEDKGKRFSGRDGAGNRRPGVDEPAANRRGADTGGGSTVIYVSYNGLRTSRADHEHLVSLINDNAGRPGASRIRVEAVG